MDLGFPKNQDCIPFSSLEASMGVPILDSTEIDSCETHILRFAAECLRRKEPVWKNILAASSLPVSEPDAPVSVPNSQITL